MRREKFFRGLTAVNVMRQPALVLPDGMSVAAAARLLLEQKVRVAPVTDIPGRCVGVLSAADILRWAAGRSRASETSDAPPACVWCDWQVVDVKTTQRDDVRRHMTRDPLLVTPETRLAQIAEALLGPNRRPVVVVNKERRPVGVVLSCDVLATLASAEHRPEKKPSALVLTPRRFPLRQSVQPVGSG